MEGNEKRNIHRCAVPDHLRLFLSAWLWAGTQDRVTFLAIHNAVNFPKPKNKICSPSPKPALFLPSLLGLSAETSLNWSEPEISAPRHSPKGGPAGSCLALIKFHSHPHFSVQTLHKKLNSQPGHLLLSRRCQELSLSMHGESVAAP